MEGASAIAELCILFLVFTIGLDLSPARLWQLRRRVFGVGVLQIALTATVIGGLAYLFGNRIDTSVVLGLTLSLSSTAVAMPLLVSRHALA